MFQKPFQVKPVYESWPTPSNYRLFPDGKDLPDKIKVWRVQHLSDKPGEFARPSGVVARPWKPEEARNAEMLAAGYNTGKMNGAVAVARDGNFLQWGFAAPPSAMTDAGRNFFLNCVCYIAKFDGKRPPAEK